MPAAHEFVGTGAEPATSEYLGLSELRKLNAALEKKFAVPKISTEYFVRHALTRKPFDVCRREHTLPNALSKSADTSAATAPDPAMPNPTEQLRLTRRLWH